MSDDSTPDPEQPGLVADVEEPAQAPRQPVLAPPASARQQGDITPSREPVLAAAVRLHSRWRFSRAEATSINSTAQPLNQFFSSAKASVPMETRTPPQDRTAPRGRPPSATQHVRRRAADRAAAAGQARKVRACIKKLDAEMAPLLTDIDGVWTHQQWVELHRVAFRAALSLRAKVERPTSNRA